MPVGANLKLRLWCPGCWRGRLVGLLCSLEMEILLRSWQELLCKRYFIINHYFIILNLTWSRLRFQPLVNYHLTCIHLLMPKSLQSFFFFFFFDVDHFWSLYSVCYNIVSVLCLVFWPWGMWDLSFPNRDWTHIPCIGRGSLNHWTILQSFLILGFPHLCGLCITHSNDNVTKTKTYKCFPVHSVSILF